MAAEMFQDTKTAVDPRQRAMLLTALYIAQEQYGYLTNQAIQRVAERMGMTPGRVLETASFYSMFRTQPVGRHVIQICEGLSCHLAGGADELLDYLVDKLEINPGETTQDGVFSLVTVQCLAACGTSPAIRVNDTLYDNLTLDKVDQILDEIRGG